MHLNRSAIVAAVSFIVIGAFSTAAFAHTPGDEVIVVPTTFATLDNGPHDADPTVGVVKIDGNLTIANGGSITCDETGTSASACPITLVVTKNLEIQAGGSIHAENLDGNGGQGGNIKITVGGDFTMRGPSGGAPGAFVSSQNFSGGTSDGGKITIIVGGVTLDESVYPAVGICGNPVGDILVENGATIISNSAAHRAGDIALYSGHNTTILGSVLAQGFTGGGHGGLITIDACCDLIIGDTGVVSSQGRDPGPDRVHLEGCVVTIYGLVESTGPAHENPSPFCTPPTRPGKAPNSTACVEIWAGTTVTIDSTGTHHGQVNADTALSGGTQGHGWIDILANGDISIIDGTGNDHVQNLPGGGTRPVNFAVHSNQYLGNGVGGDIDVESKSGKVAASGDAIQANDTTDGGDGGTVTVEAGGAGSPAGDVALDSAHIEARGANHPNSFGGVIAIRSFNGDITGSVPGSLDASAHATHPGTITLTSCIGPSYSGNTTPLATFTGGVCGGSPTFPTLAPPEAYPAATCSANCTPLAHKTGVKFEDVDSNGSQSGGEPGLNGWVIHLFGTTNTAVNIHLTTTTHNNGVIDGFYSFDIPPGTYHVCEQNQAGFTQTAPLVGSFDCSAAGADPAADNPTPGPRGYTFTVAAGETHAGNDFGNHAAPPPPPPCPEDPNAVLTKTVKPGDPQAGINYKTVQAAYNAAVNGDVIGLFGNTIENILLGGAKTLTITQCTSARVTAADPASPVWDITSTGKLKIVGPDSVGGTIGWRVGGNGGHTLKSIRASGASQWGVQINSNGNNVSWNAISNNSGGGLQVNGSLNILKGGTLASNGNDGVQLAGNSNTLSGSTISGNSGHGVLVSGSSNTVKDNGRINLNTKDGILVTGSSNTLSGNKSESGKGNTLNGIEVSGNTNQLTSNSMNSNGAVGFKNGGSGNKLKSNSTSNNTGNEYEIGAGNVNQTGNKKNGSSFSFGAAGGNFN